MLKELGHFVEGIEPEADFLERAVARAPGFGGRIRAVHGDAFPMRRVKAHKLARPAA